MFLRLGKSDPAVWSEDTLGHPDSAKFDVLKTRLPSTTPHGVVGAYYAAKRVTGDVHRQFQGKRFWLILELVELPASPSAQRKVSLSVLEKERLT